MTKDLKSKAIDIKGKKYVLVSDRVIYFNENYPNGSITTERFSEWDLEIVKATIVPDVSNPERKFTGYSQARWWDWFINKTSALENCETSAIGRWLAMMWIWVIDSIASVDEINKAESSKPVKKPTSSSDDNPNWWFLKATKSTKFMEQCRDEDDFIVKIKNKYTVDDIQEWQLREAYQIAMWTNLPPMDLPFG